MTGYFWADFIAVYPSEFIEMYEIDHSSTESFTATSKKTSAIRFIRTLKFLKLVKYNDIFYRMIETYFKLPPTQTRIAVSMMLAILCVHIFASIWWL